MSFLTPCMWRASVHQGRAGGWTEPPVDHQRGDRTARSSGEWSWTGVKLPVCCILFFPSSRPAALLAGPLSWPVGWMPSSWSSVWKTSRASRKFTKSTTSWPPTGPCRRSPSSWWALRVSDATTPTRSPVCVGRGEAHFFVLCAFFISYNRQDQQQQPSSHRWRQGPTALLRRPTLHLLRNLRHLRPQCKQSLQWWYVGVFSQGKMKNTASDTQVSISIFFRKIISLAGIEELTLFS